MSNNNARFPIYPQLQWNDRDYTSHKASLHLYEDYIVMEKFEAGQSGGAFIIDPAELASRLSGISLSTGLLPPHCIFWQRSNGEERLGIYIPAKVWPVSIEREKMTWHVPLPAFVFVGQGIRYNIWPVTVDYESLSPTTTMYKAPCPNVGETGVCTGNAPFPVASTETIWKAVEVFFESGFNNHLADHRCVSNPGNVLDLWRDLWRDLQEHGDETFPKEELISARLTLGRVIDGNF